MWKMLQRVNICLNTVINFKAAISICVVIIFIAINNDSHNLSKYINGS